MHHQVLIPGGALPDHEDEVPDNDRRGQQASFFDPLRYKLPANVRPFFEDRILVRRIEKAADPCHVCAENQALRKRGMFVGCFDEHDCPAPPLIATPEKAEREKRGPQLGIVVALGPGATGRGILPGDDPNSIPKSERWRRFKRGTRIGMDLADGRSFTWFCPARVLFEVKVGDTIWYERVPNQEFMRDGELYTFLFEEQSVIGVVE